MLRRREVGPAGRVAGMAVLAVLCAGGGLAAWAAQPPQVRVVLRPAYLSFAAPRPEAATVRDGLASVPDAGAAEPATTVAGHRRLDPSALDAAGGLAASAPVTAEADAGGSASEPQTAQLQAEQTPPAPAVGDAGRLQLANLQPSEPLAGSAATPSEPASPQLPAPAPSEAVGGAKLEVAVDKVEDKVCFSGRRLGSRSEIQFCMVRALWLELGRRDGAKLCFSGALPGKASAEQFCMDRRYWSKVEDQHRRRVIATNAYMPGTAGAPPMLSPIDFSTYRPQ